MTENVFLIMYPRVRPEDPETPEDKQVSLDTPELLEPRENVGTPDLTGRSW